jgi:hypothetical protein
MEKAGRKSGFFILSLRPLAFAFLAPEALANARGLRQAPFEPPGVALASGLRFVAPTLGYHP